MADKIFKHLGYDPGEELQMAFEMAPSHEAGTIHTHNSVAMAIIGGVSTQFNDMVQFVTDSPKPIIEPAASNWASAIADKCVMFNHGLTEALLQVLALNKAFGVDDWYLSKKLNDILTKEGVQDSIYFEKYTPKTLFSYASFIVHQKYNIGTNIRIEAVNISNHLIGVGPEGLFCAGNHIGVPQLMYLKMFLIDALNQYNKAVLLHVETPTEAHHETMREEAVKALIHFTIVLVFMGYKLDNIVTLSKAVCQKDQ